MRTIVVDDEPWMLKRFVLECESLPAIQLLGSFKSPLRALEFAASNPVELAFLDVEMPELNGLELAHKLREITPEIIIVFVSAYDKYMTEAFRTKTADYFIMKPYNKGDIEVAVDRARLLSGRLQKAVRAHTFGTFELLSENVPVVFEDEKSKELFALLIDGRGSIIQAETASGLLWPNASQNERKISFHRTLKHMNETLSALHLDSVVGMTDFGAFIHTNAIDCDLYRFLDGDTKTVWQYSGDYMLGYTWAKEHREKLARKSEQFDLIRNASERDSHIASVRTINNQKRTICYMNDNFLSLVGYTRDEIKNRFNNSFRAMILREDYESSAATVQRFFAEGTPVEIEYRITGKNDKEISVICKSNPPKIGSDNINEISSVLIDISKTTVNEGDKETPPHRDSLTGLCNLSFAKLRIEQYLASTAFAPKGALIIIDADDFKTVNETYGRPFADTVLSDIAAILMRAFRTSDIVCRLESDEMMVFLKGIDSVSTANEKLESVIAAIQERLSLKTQRGELSCSFGSAIFPQDGCNYETLFANACIALQKAKKKKNSSVWFSDIQRSSESI